MDNLGFTKEATDAIFAYFILHKLGCGQTETFKERIESQKVQYLAQLFGVSPKYQFNLYLHGPYSPSLANDLFKISEHKIKVDNNKFASDELENKFADLKKFITKNKSIRQLELITTLHWLLKMANLSAGEAIKKLVELKNATTEEIRWAFNSIKQLPA